MQSNEGTSPPAEIFEQRPTIAGIISGLAEFALGAGFVQTWIDPTRLGVGWVSLAFELMVVEMLLIHANCFLNWQFIKPQPESNYKQLILVFAAGYIFFGTGLSLGMKSWGPLIAVIGLSASRTWAARYKPPPQGVARKWFFAQMGMNLFFYVGFGAIVTFVPLPSLGVSSSMTPWDPGDFAVYTSRPYTMVVMASGFYLVRGWITMWAWPRRRDLSQLAV